MFSRHLYYSLCRGIWYSSRQWQHCYPLGTEHCMSCLSILIINDWPVVEGLLESRRTTSHTNSPHSTPYTTCFHLIPYEPPNLRETTEMVKPLGRLRPNRQRIETWINITQTQVPLYRHGHLFFFLKENITIHFFPERLTSQVKAISRKKKKAELLWTLRTDLS